MSLAIYEIVGLILALPLSYAMAYFAKKYSNKTYKDELDTLFTAYWSGKEEDALYAWLRVKQLINVSENPKKARYIDTKIRDLNKTSIYADSSVNEKGELV